MGHPQIKEAIEKGNRPRENQSYYTSDLSKAM